MSLVFLLASAPLPAASGTIDTVRANFVDYYTAGGADRGSPRMAESLRALESQARDLSAPGYLRGDGSWSDINYSEIPSGNWSPWDHTRRLLVLAKAYRTPGQTLYGDPQLRAAIESALAYVPKYYGYWTVPNGNWWFWTIGVPLDLGPTLVLMRGDVSQSVFDDCVKSMAVKIGTSPTSKGIVGPTPTGENLTWSCFTHLTLALLKDDATMLAAVRDAMTTACTVTTDDGIQPDASFHQHGPQLYNGGYGAAFASDVARYALITRDTDYALSAPARASFANYLADGIAATLYGNYFDVSVVGRYVARSSTSGYDGVAALVQAAQFDSPRRETIAAAAASALRSWSGALPPELAGAATLVESQSFAKPPLTQGSAHAHFFSSDYTVHRRPAWFASVKMLSTRTKSGEKTNGENLLGSRQSDGRFYLALDGDEYFGRDAWPALDWSRLPGITVEQTASAANDTYGYGMRSFAGGTGDGARGVSAMDVAPLGSSLTAHKSWFFFDDAIVFLTSAITAPSANRVETIVNQWPLHDPAAPLTSGTNWMACEGVGYWFPNGTGGNLHSDRITRTGTWAALGGSDDTTPHTSTFLTLWLDHATNPVNATAAYAIVPRTTPDAMRAWAASEPLTIVANSSGAAAVRDSRDGALGIVFWAAGASVDGITSSIPAVVWLTRAPTTVQLSAADPNGGSGSFTVTLPAAWTGRATTVTLPRNGGRTTTVTVPRASSKLRAVRR